MLRADLERDALLREADTAEDPHRIAEIQTRLVDIDAHSAPARAAAILSGLGFSTADQAHACAEFSGGWRMRVALAATLFSAPDLLLLDEPTNYLDLEGTLWLEDHLANYPRTVIVISHDRDLLDTSVDQILHLDRGKLTLYKGTYSSFEEQRATREMLDAKHAKRQADERKRLQAFVDRFKAKASKARQAQSRVKMLERMKPVTALVTQDVREISFPTPEKMLSPPLIAVDDVSVGYDEKPVLNRVTLRIVPTTASHRSAPTATASRRWSSCSPASLPRSPARSPAPTSSRSDISRSIRSMSSISTPRPTITSAS